MIVVVGHPYLRAESLGGGVDGLAGRIAVASSAAGGDVQFVGKVGDDPPGDELLLALAAAGVGHVALLRDPARRTPVVVAEPDDADDERTADAADAPSGALLDPPDPAEHPTLEPADVDLALQYLTDFAVVVVAEPGIPELVPPAATAASYAGAALVVLVEPGGRVDAPREATVIEVPPADPDGAFATLIGTLAADLDQERVPVGGIADAAGRLGWTRPTDD